MKSIFIRKSAGFCLLLLVHVQVYSQVDTSYVYKTGTPYGMLDIRIAKSPTRYYYLEENKTISFRESSPGVKTNTYRDITSWDSNPYSEGNLREKNGAVDAFVMNYRLLFPNNYTGQYAEGYPLMLFMHGAGERGNCWMGSCYHADSKWRPAANTPPAPTSEVSRLMNNDHNLLHGGKVYLDARNAAGTLLPNDPALPGRSFPGFVLFPQNLNGWDGVSAQDAIRLVRLIAKKYNIDENRIYITGLSNGGQAMLDVVKRAPWLFAAALPMSAPGDGGIIGQSMTADVAHIPFWFFQGGKDSSPSRVVTETRIKKLREAGTIVRYSLYPNLGHGTWNSAFKEPDYFQWILAKNKSNIHLFAGSSSICLNSGEGVKMELAAGFRAYQWQKDGVIILSATNHTYVANAPGSYRARFSRVVNPTEKDWNKWSLPVMLTEKNPAPAQLEQTGTVLLTDLNNVGEARLYSAEPAAYYYWFKNGEPLNIADTVRYTTINPGEGNGVYTLITAGYENCLSPKSNTKSIFFNNSAPLNIQPPVELTASLASQTHIKLAWHDASSNEEGFELWRRKVISGTTYSPWELITLTAANVETYINTGVEPSTVYHYKIRAVSSSGRSEYTPAGQTSYVTIITDGDYIKPTAPQNVQAKAIAINTIQLSWKPSTDNTGIRQYRIYYDNKSVQTNSAVTNFTISNLSLNTQYSFTIKAEDLQGNLSSASDPALADTYVNGLFYEHSTGAWVDLDGINWTNAEFQGTIATFSIAPRTQEDYFNFKFDGYLYITQAGNYQFQTISSDGSRIELDGVIVVNNDGVHASRTITSSVQNLITGPKRISVKFFEYDESHVLTVRYKGPDTDETWKIIPATALKSGDAPLSSFANTERVELSKNEPGYVFPSPTTQHNINIKMESAEEALAYITITDLNGTLIFAGSYAPEKIREGFKIMPQKVMYDGIYFLQITQAKKITQQKIWIKN
jgi:hypothetical protein